MILIVDDDPAFRGYASALLTRAGFETCEAGDGVEALAVAREKRPTVALVNPRIPGLDGYSVFRRLRDDYGDEIGVIFVSGTRTEAYDQMGGLLLGADDYIVKPFDSADFIARVSRIAHSTRATNGQASNPSKIFGLTPREYEILALLVDGKTQKDIARILVISSKTVATHIQRILGKLGVNSRAQAVALALRNRSLDHSVSAHMTVRESLVDAF